MPQPAEVTAVADELIALYREAQRRLLVELGDALMDPRRWRQAQKLRALIATHAEIIAVLDSGTREWLSVRLPEVHALGARNAARTVGSAFQWTAPHVHAVEQMAATAWDDVALNLQQLRSGGRRALRELARDATRSTLLEGRTAAQSGRLLEGWARDRGIGSVVYRDGSRRMIGDYADMVARTTTANSYNAGTLTQTASDGIEWVEVFDGSDCGWTSHNDPLKANGRVMPLDEANQYPISHPRCARSFGPRPDIASQKAADAARRFTDVEQDQMADEERQRAAEATVTLSGRPRRASREPRTARVASTR